MIRGFKLIAGAIGALAFGLTLTAQAHFPGARAATSGPISCASAPRAASTSKCIRAPRSLVAIKPASSPPFVKV